MIPITVHEKVDSSMLRAVFAEFFATFLFVYIGTGSVVASGSALIDDTSFITPFAPSIILPVAFAFGMAIMVLVYAFGHISGGHINPAVTFSLTLTNQCSVVRGSLYVLAQLVGATFGSLFLWAACNGLQGHTEPVFGEFEVVRPPFNIGVNGLNPHISAGNGFVYEMMGTLLLCITVHMTAVNKKSLAQGQPTNAPIAIGFAVFLAHLLNIPYTGCGINPARTFGPALVNSFAGVPSEVAWSGVNFWIYWIGPLVGATIAALVYKFLDYDLNETPSEAETESNEMKKNTADASDIEMGAVSKKAEPLSESNVEGDAKVPTADAPDEKVQTAEEVKVVEKE